MRRRGLQQALYKNNANIKRKKEKEEGESMCVCVLMCTRMCMYV